MDKHRWVAGAVVVGLIWLALQPSNAGPAPGSFAVYHYDSVEQGLRFREVFRVHWVEGTPVPTEEVDFYRDGEAFHVNWTDANGVVGEGDRFHFVEEAFDTPHVLRADWKGVHVMECRYGGGAGLPVEPEAAAASGQLRCLHAGQTVE